MITAHASIEDYDDDKKKEFQLHLRIIVHSIWYLDFLMSSQDIEHIEI